MAVTVAGTFSRLGGTTQKETCFQTASEAKLDVFSDGEQNTHMFAERRRK